MKHLLDGPIKSCLVLGCTEKCTQCLDTVTKTGSQSLKSSWLQTETEIRHKALGCRADCPCLSWHAWGWRDDLFRTLHFTFPLGFCCINFTILTQVTYDLSSCLRVCSFTQAFNLGNKLSLKLFEWAVFSMYLQDDRTQCHRHTKWALPLCLTPRQDAILFVFKEDNLLILLPSQQLCGPAVRVCS